MKHHLLQVQAQLLACFPHKTRCQAVVSPRPPPRQSHKREVVVAVRRNSHLSQHQHQRRPQSPSSHAAPPSLNKTMFPTSRILCTTSVSNSNSRSSLSSGRLNTRLFKHQHSQHHLPSVSEHQYTIMPLRPINNQWRCPLMAVCMGRYYINLAVIKYRSMIPSTTVIAGKVALVLAAQPIRTMLP